MLDVLELKLRMFGYLFFFNDDCYFILFSIKRLS